ncbi:MAG: hypothetical protein ABI791_02125 [Acidobacteriota bacterium]
MTQNPVDDKGTGQPQAREMMTRLNESAGHGSLEELGLIMGRPEDELRRFLDGAEPIDDDFVMKMRGVAQERGIDLG